MRRILACGASYDTRPRGSFPSRVPRRRAVEPGSFTGPLKAEVSRIYSPVSHKKPSVLATGQAHQFHLSVRTTHQYLHAAGFNVLECKLDKTRKSDFRHIRVVAQRPPNEPEPSSIKVHPSSISMLKHRLWILEKTWKFRLFTLYSKRKLKKLVRSRIQ